MRVGIFGATGQVGAVMRDLLESRAFPAEQVRFFASARSAGTHLAWAGGELPVEDAASADFRGLDLALCSMGATASRELAPRIADAGAVVVDNSSAWRMDPEVPLVVPEVNAAALGSLPKGIVANPNCTTMVCMAPLAALRDLAGLRRVVAATYQAVSGAGAAGVAELAREVAAAGDEAPALAFDGRAVGLGQPAVFAGPVAYNVLPLAGSLVDEETNEEHKFRDESRKILDLAHLGVVCTCVRVPVYTGHSVALTVELERPVELDAARAALASAAGVELVEVPTPLEAAGRDAVLVGRVRVDHTVEAGLSLFVSGDNLRKGAALNAIQIAEELLARSA